MYRYGLILLIFLFSVFQQRATEKDLWIFGKGASLKFDSPTSNPYSLSSDFLINSPEAAATGFDKDGNLLFYSDGVNVWNYENTVIYSSLQGNQDATQGITVFKPPSIDSLFYLVTQNISTFKKGSYIYKLDFRANPKGVVNINPEYLEFSNTSFERLEVVPHYNNQDFWIITNPHYENDSEYFVYLYDSSGVNLISRFESKHKRNFNEGYLKASPNGRYLVSADIDANSIEMVEFDNELGILKNAKIYKDPKLDAGVYGIEFSPNSRFLYLTIYQHLSGNKSKSLCLQLDFNSYYFANDDITHEVFNLVHDKNEGGMWGIKRAINGRIYIACNNLSYLSVINSPDNGGINCSFKELGPIITTNNDKCLRGLPSTAANSYISDYEIVDIKKCVGDFINYIPQANIDYSQYHWLGNNSIRNEKNLAIVDLEIDDSGIYYLTNKITNKVILAVRLRIGAKKEFEITAKPNSVVCGVDSILLKPNSKFEKYEWSTGEKDSVLWVKESGKYTLIATNEFG